MSKKGERFASPSKVSLASAELLSSATRIPATTLEGIAPAPVQRATVTVLQAAEMLGISRSAAYEGVLRKEIPSLKIGRRVLVPKAALERLLAGEMR